MTTLAPTDRSLARDVLTVLQPGFTGTSAPEWLLRQLRAGLSSVALFGRNIESPEQLAALTAELRAVRPDVLVAIDEEGGDVTRLEARTGSSFPGNLALGTVDDPELTWAVAHALGRRLAACGVNLNWAPSADVNANPDNPVIGVRSFGSDPQLVARHTVSYVEGLQAAGVAACVKHFPGHGDTAIDSHHSVPRIDAQQQTLDEREFVPFRAAVAAGCRCVMSAHILLPALDPDRPGTLSPAVLSGLLRAPRDQGGIGHNGLIVTDGMEMQAIAAAYGLERGSVLALAAGADAICVGGGLADEDTVLRLRDALVRAVRDGELTRERLADAAARVRVLARWTSGSQDGSGNADRSRSTAHGAVKEGAPGDVRPSAAPPTPATWTDDAEETGLMAARRALRVTGRDDYEPIVEPPFVVAFTPLANIAVGDETPWGLAAELARLLPGTRTVTHAQDALASVARQDWVSAVLAEAADRRIVAVVRDLHRHSWMSEALHALLDARPQTVVVEMGLPQAPPVGELHIATHGAARVCGRAAAEVIVGKGADS
ncbi:glycoside hydrolase family 3 protein [Streptomyces oceani]|uniref:Sugar hydrolase n=1 Tax=Streptomyces oceani TaxID=1075402 RepID=A0A1E7KPV8_9ACTN|nr:glycoside hydrolase family 3 protein [Streptomyces oceani]OEV05891.1 sugar hydrolase [Streptomyces oceani]